MILFSWVIGDLGVTPTVGELTNVVNNARWEYWADDGEGHTAMIFGEEKFGAPDSGSFTPFDQLTQAQVSAWIEQQVGEEEMNRKRAYLTANIAEQVAPPPTILPPPWA